MRQLGLKRENARVAVNGISKSEAGTTRGKVKLRISSRFDVKESVVPDAYILLSLTTKMPQLPLKRSDWKFITNLPLADPEFDSPNSVDVIIGSRELFQVLRAGQVKESRSGNHIAQNTIFGYVMTGDQSVSVENV